MRNRKEPLKVVHLVSSLNVGGAEKFVCNLSEQQLKSGMASTVLSFGTEHEPFYQRLQSAGIPVLLCNYGLLKRWIFLQKLWHFDIIHIHSPGVLRTLLPLLPVLACKRLIYTIHGEVDPQLPLLKLAHQLYKPWISAITAVSTSSAQSTEIRYGWNSSKIHVIPNGVLIRNLGTHNRVSSKIKLGVVSRLIPLKNLKLLFEALQQLSAAEQSGFELHIFGDGPCKAELENLSQEPGLPTCIFHGNVGSEQDIFSAFDVLVMCSDTEGLPMSVIESMSYGKPVISTHVGAIPSVITSGENGWLYAPGDAVALAEILSGLTEKCIEEFSVKAKAVVTERFSIEASDAHFLKLYQSGSDYDHG